MDARLINQSLLLLLPLLMRARQCFDLDTHTVTSDYDTHVQIKNSQRVKTGQAEVQF
jgi:hypothetical protein